MTDTGTGTLADGERRYWYVYAVTPAAGPPPPDGLRGVDGAPLCAVPHDDLTAVVGAVPAADFAEEPLRRHLEDLAWLEATARGHQRVIDALTADPGCVLPLRLATVCRDTAGVRRLLSANQERFLEAISRLAGRAEWGVKVFADAPERTETAPATGRDYLRQRARRRTTDDEAWRRAEETARAVHLDLDAVAEQSRLHRPQDPRLSGESGRNLLNGAYLVPQEREQEFCALVGRLAGQLCGPRLNLTGPWAPYSFAQVNDLAPDPDSAPEPARENAT
ncbi:GvpL/GvpF family gas vesicle protein [Streptomyces sp. MP131-18]|uniref:GvpL/GvpF family gas vesicle protein n=1 Tax=Streptomyces sp. MP131-18 TaxID=1857892 RepID=UPI00097CB1B3|nr:GvpL/GvpF family gas vesicle protein [Streptomyces sp. MP131-18]ONK15422.1 Gas vesicle synthesis protein GvpL/GvpF [Streptomyces sp. MP131-18]